MIDYQLTIDKERTLRYNNRAFRELEKLMGNKPILAVLMEVLGAKSDEERNSRMMNNFFSSDFLTNFVYVGLIHEKDISRDKVIDIIPVSKYVEIMNFAMNVIMTEFGVSSTMENKPSGEKKSLTETTGTGTMQN